ARLVAHERDGEEGLETARAAGDDADRPRRRHGGDVAVPEELLGTYALAVLVARAGLVRAPDAPRPLGERTTLVGQTLALALSLDIQELHDLPPELDPFRRVVGDAEAHEGVGEAHHAESDAADPLA